MFFRENKQDNFFTYNFLGSKLLKQNLPSDKILSYFYYILNLDNGVIKFGISKNPQDRLSSYIHHFSSYARTPKDRLKCRVSKKPIPIGREIEAEKLWLDFLEKDPNFEIISGKEFFLMRVKNLQTIDPMFGSFVALVTEQGNGAGFRKRVASIYSNTYSQTHYREPIHYQI